MRPACLRIDQGCLTGDEETFPRPIVHDRHFDTATDSQCTGQFAPSTCSHRDSAEDSISPLVKAENILFIHLLIPDVVRDNQVDPAVHQLCPGGHSSASAPASPWPFATIQSDERPRGSQRSSTEYQLHSFACTAHKNNERIRIRNIQPCRLRRRRPPPQILLRPCQ